MNPIAQDALDRGSNRLALKSGTGVKKKASSRDADKFVARLPEGMRDRLQARSDHDGQSMNSVLVEALRNHLEKRDEQQILLDALALLKKDLQEAIAVAQASGRN